ncbi:MAG: gamma carbonic anhydrase family protein [Candidatus Thermoplasmatota archaeon]|jgi:carbonic anhydrase/acetyltransferase-like protein (isoleucine patch superfamily)|nr:gamma carbonic anhydrase family protein [Candidatus Thermoplasmatota archaeon]
MESKNVVIGKDTFISKKCSLRGQIEIGERASIFDFASIRADLDKIVIGNDSNIQDNCTLHVDPGFPVKIGNLVSVGHNAVIHGCTIDDECIIGMGAIIMNGAKIGSGSVVGAGTLVLENQVVPENSLVVGVPGKVIRNDSSYREMARKNAMEYGTLREKYLLDEE